MKNKFNRFSVSMSVYKNDNPNHFKIAVESVFNQTLVPNEIVLVVDGPVCQEISNIIFKFEELHSNFKVIWEKVNKGHAAARRIGLENCSNDIVALMDSDDISVSDRFENQLEEFNRDNSVSIIGGQIEEFNDEKSDSIVGLRIVPLSDDKIKDYMRYRCPMNQVSVMFKKEDVMTSGGYLDWHNNEDYYLWIRMAIAGLKFKNIEETLVKVRVNNNMYKRRGGWSYFLSEAKLQKFMFKNRLIGFYRFSVNVCIRFLLQVLFPNALRKYIFVNLIRKS